MTSLLAPGVVHVIRARLDAPPIALERLESVLSAEEVAQAGRFVFREDRVRHVLGRGLLRRFIGRELDVDPSLLRFETTAAGKPVLSGGPSFNISHSGPFVLVALAPDGRLGVDVEAIRQLDDLEPLARRTFAPDELEELWSHPAEGRLRAFYRLWSRKEAVLKALGLGIAALESISVSAEPDAGNALRRLDQPGEEAGAWTVRPMFCGDEVESAVAWDRELRAVTMSDRL